MRTRPNKEIIYYVTPKISSEMIDEIIRWKECENTEIVHFYDYATPDHDVWKLFDRGYKLIRDGKPDPKAYQELKRLIGIDGEDRISYNFFEELEGRGLVKDIILEDDDLEDEEALY